MGAVAAVAYAATSGIGYCCIALAMSGAVYRVAAAKSVASAACNAALGWRRDGAGLRGLGGTWVEMTWVATCSGGVRRGRKGRERLS